MNEEFRMTPDVFMLVFADLPSGSELKGIA